MSPRPAPTRDDATARAFLNAGMRLVEAMFSVEPRQDRPARLRALHFPAPLEWIRVQDVIRESRQETPSISPKAFWNRWHDKDSFVVDLALAAFADTLAPETLDLRLRLESSDGSFSARIEALTGSVMSELLAHPRSLLLGHLASVMHGSPELRDRIVEATADDVRGWVAFYGAVVDAVGLTWRPGWTAVKAQIAIQGLMDGLLIRSRLIGPTIDGHAWHPVDVFTDAVTALFASILDLDQDGRTVGELLDDGVARASHPR